jgi:O-methyltransferase
VTEETVAERYAEVLREAERKKAATLPDTPENHLIRRILDQPYVWVNADRLQNLHRLATSYNGRSGAFVECGVAGGASLAMMAAFAGDRTVWGFDSFAGLPPLSERDGGDGEVWVGITCSGPGGEATVHATFEGVGVSMDRTRIVKGWFADTIPGLVDEIGPIAILRLDADWYEATRFLLQTLYGSVMPGGVVVIDDYGAFEGCREAVDEFRATRSCNPLQRVPDGVEAYWYV